MLRVPDLGKPEDREYRAKFSRKDDVEFREKISAARDLIYARNYAVTNDHIEAKLKAHSLTPNNVSSRTFQTSIKFTLGASQNAFSERLSAFGFNMFPMLVVDLMHEVELGIWRSLFIHLLRILEHEGRGLLLELDRR